ncbi:MAG: NAD(+) synthase [Treponema sp.]|nr:NAD(+) synthase [Treponema sp.]
MFDAAKTKEQIIQWIKDYFNDNQPDTPYPKDTPNPGDTQGLFAVIGISGGKDSTITAALCAQALGADRVFGVLMPCGEQWDLSVCHDVVQFLGIQYCVIDIKEITDAFSGTIANSGLLMNRQAAINVPARIRMAVLYAVSAIVKGRVANTCNLSENWVGYSTKFGDSAGDFSPLSQFTVTELKALGRELGLPPQFIDKTPEDGLSGLTDEENLGFSYATLDKYIRSGLCEDMAVKEKIDRLHKTGLHKINAMPCFNRL